MEMFAIPGVGGIIERCIDGKVFVLLQERYKDDPQCTLGMIEIPAGKVRAFENVYDCLRREIFEETGLFVTEIVGEDKAEVYECEDYKVVNYTPFSCSQNTKGDYPIMVEVFICKADGELVKSSNEAKNFKWVEIWQLDNMIKNNAGSFFPMHVSTLKKYCNTFSELIMNN